MPRELTIEEVVEILSMHPFLPKPDVIVFIPHRVVLRGDVVAFLVRGFAMSSDGRSVVVFTYDAVPETVVHEVLHVAGLGEIGARLLSPILYGFRSFVKPLVKRQVSYVECPNGCGNPMLAVLGAKVYVRR